MAKPMTTAKFGVLMRSWRFQTPAARLSPRNLFAQRSYARPHADLP
jgi:hypothetical protein